MSLNTILIELGFKPHPSNWKHFAVGILLGGFAFLFTHFELDYNLFSAIGFGCALAFVIGFIKEWIDRPKFDWLDLIMTTLGGFAGALIGATLTIWL